MKKEKFMNFINFLVENLAIITALFSGGNGWFFGLRNKQCVKNAFV
jgi:hypothetical protein